MDKKKTALKGFTLIELIIVLAIFSVIMTLVMSFIDPVSKIMTKTSVRERTAAYVDNIGEYVSKSIRHAQNIVVYEHGISDDEQTVARDFVDTYYNGAINSSGAPLAGKVHVLKLINKTDGSLEAGHIYETVYDFTAGCGIPTTVYFDPSANSIVPDSTIASMTQDQIDAAGYTKLTQIKFDSDSQHATVSAPADLTNVSVINDEHFKDYSYYYQLGMYDFVPITDSLDSYEDVDTGDALVASDDYFYSKLKPSEKDDGTVISDSVNEYQFVMNVISFQNKTQSVFETIHDGETVMAFKSPAAMSAVGMTFKNVQMQKESSSVKYYRKAMNTSGEFLDKDGNVTADSSQAAIEAVTNNLGASPFRRVTEGDPNNNNIYIVFTVPTEIEDTVWSDPPEPTIGGPI